MQFDVHRLMQKIVSSIIVRSIRIAVIHLFGVAVQHLHTLIPQSIQSIMDFIMLCSNSSRNSGSSKLRGVYTAVIAIPSLKLKKNFL